MTAPMQIASGPAGLLPMPLLEALYAFRQRVFGADLGWREERAGRDRYDALGPVYIVASRGGRVVGCLRLMPTAGPCMTHECFAHLLDEAAAHRGPQIWELSRFAAGLDTDAADPQCACADVAKALFAHALAYARAKHITRLVGVATVPVLAFAGQLGLAPRPVFKAVSTSADDRPVAFTVEVAAAGHVVPKTSLITERQYDENTVNR